MGHHSSMPFDDETLRQMFPERNIMDDLQQPFGATGRFPMGKLNLHDEGEIAFGVTADKKSGKIILDFGKPTAWIGMDAKQAIELAECLIKRAIELE